GLAGFQPAKRPPPSRGRGPFLMSATGARVVQWRRAGKQTIDPPGLHAEAMTIATPALPPPDLIYPDSDGEPMAENTIQYRHLTRIKGGLEVVCRDRPDVFIAGDLFWYPVEGHPEIRLAPDVLV